MAGHSRPSQQSLGLTLTLGRVTHIKCYHCYQKCFIDQMVLLVLNGRLGHTSLIDRARGRRRTSSVCKYESTPELLGFLGMPGAGMHGEMEELPWGLLRLGPAQGAAGCRAGRA